ncbi:hypothetical protein C4K37_0611 [Pseudomonas chlororaphis subsp. piscium]|nr:hypothetical protein C4K37_0611 [Pseudomonas chlororaphis subsp. piscium]AZC41565.1 hypothetical protein C4K36_0613 [Pseudomonas chlororaphis subsp. piscium]
MVAEKAPGIVVHAGGRLVVGAKLAHDPGDAVCRQERIAGKPRSY